MHATMTEDVINAKQVDRGPAASYSTEVEGGKPVRRRYAIRGRLRAATFLDFVAERAAWFGISGWASADGSSAIDLVAAGPEALVGALEMAVTLGPLDALVETAARPETGEVPPGFELRR